MPFLGDEELVDVGLDGAAVQVSAAATDVLAVVARGDEGLGAVGLAGTSVLIAAATTDKFSLEG